MVLLGVIYTFIGKVWTRSCWVYRAESPKLYWCQVASYYLGGAVLIGDFLNKIHAL